MSIFKDTTNGLTPEQVLAESLHSFCAMPLETQQKVVRMVLDHDEAQITEALLPNILRELKEDERSHLGYILGRETLLPNIQ